MDGYEHIFTLESCLTWFDVRFTNYYSINLYLKHVYTVMSIFYKFFQNEIEINQGSMVYYMVGAESYHLDTE